MTTREFNTGGGWNVVPVIAHFGVGAMPPRWPKHFAFHDGRRNTTNKRKESNMKTTTLISRSTMLSAAGLALLLVSRASLPADELTPGSLKGSVTMELIGQAQVLSPQAAIQFGYLSRIEGLETIFTGTPQNESTAIFTFYNDTATTRVINNGPLRIANREGTATFYLNPSAGADFSKPDSFRTGTPVMTASLTHQVVLDTVQNTFITQFSLTITSVAEFTVDGHEYRLGKPGQKVTWVVYGRPSTSSTTFAIAGFALSQ
jgi:hypothetical protein